MVTVPEKHYEDVAWKNANNDDLWVFDKLIVARKLGYNCGPTGVDVNKPGTYIVRPCVNILGMSRCAYFTEIEKDTTHLPEGHFWCEIFQGRHISVDYRHGSQTLAVEGFRKAGDPLWKFSKWKKVDDVISLPQIFFPLIERYEYINVEYINGNCIEAHLRPNHDFIHGNTIAIPVWNESEEIEDTKGLEFWSSPDYNRKGFWID